MKITKHCVQRLSERFLLDLSYHELNNIRKLIKTGYYIKLEEDKDESKIKLITRYKGRYIKFVMDKYLNQFITALPYHPNDMTWIEQFVKEFDK